METVGTTAPASGLTHRCLVMQSGRTFAQKYSQAHANRHHLHSFCVIGECYKALAYVLCLMTPEAALIRPNVRSNNGWNAETTVHSLALKMDEALSSEKLVNI